MKEQSSQYDEATRKEYEAQRLELQQQKHDLELNLKKYKTDLAKEQKQLAELNNKKQELSNALEQDPAELNQQLEQARTDYIDILQAQTSNNNQIVYLNNEIERNQKAQNSNTDTEKELKEAQARLADLKKHGNKLVEEKDNLEKKIASQRNIVEQTKQAEANLERKIKNIEGQLSQYQAQLSGLKRLQERHEGYYAGVKYILKQQNNLTGVIGVIGELISFPAKLEAAISTALGAGVQNIVTQTREAARDAIDLLKRHHAGRATFLPLDGVRQSSIANSTLNTLKEINGFIGVAADLVSTKTEQDISKAINYLLGNVLVAQDMDTALRIQNRTGHYYRIVTLEGDIISPGGSMTGGARNRSTNSPLQTNSEIQRIQTNIASLQESLTESKAQLKEIQINSASDNKIFSELQDKLQSVSQQINEQAIRYQGQEQELARIKKVKNIQDAEQKAKSLEAKNLDKQLADEKKKHAELDKRATSYKEKMDRLKVALADLDQAYAKIQADLGNVNSEIAVVKNQSANLHSQAKQTEQALKNSDKQIVDLDNKITDLAKAGKTGKTPEEIKQAIKNLSLEKDKLTVALAEANKFLGKQEAKINQLELLSNRNYDLRKDAAQEQEQYSVQLSKVSGEINNRLTELREEYSLTFEAALALCSQDNTPEYREKLQRTVKLNKMSLEDIGPVNLSSIEEYEDVKTRYDFLNNQQNDLLKARKDIEDSMSALDETVRTRFSETFNKIEEKFEKIFPLMFGGGSAQLVLTDPDDLLHTGVDIIAQPPGKKLQGLSLLSGGERALTAITLLFAILEVNPTPFCILDEVEAALDDANVTRFAKFLSRYNSSTQFIVITHRRGTMEQADQLYGVVMQESGVSQVLSVSLKEIKDEVK